MLKFSTAGNAKLGKNITTFSLPPGITCRHAKDCFAKVVEDSNGKKKLVVGKHTKFVCFAAPLALVFPSLYMYTKSNLEQLKECGNSVDKIEDLIKSSISVIPGLEKRKYFRVHVSGDFFSQSYFDAWMRVAKHFKDKVFYCYTKALPFLCDSNEPIPENFVITASRGGTHDSLIDKFPSKIKKECVVVFHPDEAKKLGLKIDHDDSLAIDPNVKKFALLLHGMQKSGTKASKAIIRMNKEKIDYAYRKRKK